MSAYVKTCICAQVRSTDEGNLSIDQETVTTGEDYFAAARAAGDIQPGAMVAVWTVDNLILDDWSGEQLLSHEMAVGQTKTSQPFTMLLRAEWDEFFQLSPQHVDRITSRLLGYSP